MKLYAYFKIKKERNEWLGHKFFRVADDTDSVIQVVLVPGEMKKGRPNTIGIYYITKQSFASNIFQYVELATKKQYQNAFDKVFTMLK